jgi:ascorbate-specific PTS system EIIC-type component UlaA
VREVGIGCVNLALLYMWIKFCARNNPVAYFLVGVINALIGTVYYMYKYSTIHTTDLLLISAFLVTPFFVPFAFRNAAETVTAED